MNNSSRSACNYIVADDGEKNERRPGGGDGIVVIGLE